MAVPSEAGGINYDTFLSHQIKSPRTGFGSTVLPPDGFKEAGGSRPMGRDGLKRKNAGQ